MEQPENNKIYLPELLRLLGRRWKWLLVAALVGALILGGLRLTLDGIVLSDPERLAKAEDRNSLFQEKYEAEKLSLEQQIASLRESIARRQTYLDNSVLMRLDPYGHSVGSLLVQIRTDYQIQPGMTYQDPDPTDSLVAAYGAEVRSAALMSRLAVKAELSTVYMAELITVVTDLETNSLKVQLRHTDAETLEELLQLVQAHLQELSGSMTDAHTAQITNLGIRAGMDLELQTKQTEARAETDTLIKSLTEARSRLDQLEEPTERPVTWLQALGHSGLFALLGAAAGSLVFCLAYCLYSAGSEQMLSPRMLRDAGLPVLAGKEPRYVALELQSRCPEGLLVAGKLPCDMEKALRQLPGVTLAADILHNTEDLQALQGCGGVVLAVPYGCGLEVLRQQQTLMKAYKKELIGCLLLDSN